MAKRGIPLDKVKFHNLQSRINCQDNFLCLKRKWKVFDEKKNVVCGNWQEDYMHKNQTSLIKTQNIDRFSKNKN
jgi:hypothetical protein